jgi:division protein CdvB (Snf7/Vps24/ESCRT-III family)
MQAATYKMGSALGAMDLVAVNESMMNFEKMFDNLDVNAEFMDRVMDNVNAGTTDENGVKDLIGQVASEFNLKLQDEFEGISAGNKVPGQQEVQKEKQLNSGLNI